MNGPTISRRTTLTWLAATMAVTACKDGSGLAGGSWPNTALPAVPGPGYGVDPDLMNPKVPWKLTMTPAELRTTGVLVDLILPADGKYKSASQVGVPAFINEWVSAPYPNQQNDRSLIIPGLVWLDDEAERRGAKDFASADAALRTGIADDIAFKDKVKPGLEKPAKFFAQVRKITLGVYYSTEAGWAEIGYLGNSPIDGPYPGPSAEAAAHIAMAIAAL